MATKWWAPPRKKPAQLLLRASRDGDVELVRALLPAVGADARDRRRNLRGRRRYKRTPLHWAAERGHVAVVDVLLGHGADVDAADRLGNTPLHVAVSWKQAQVIPLLIAARATVDVTNYHDETPLHWAAQQGYLEAIQLLLNAGANIQAFDRLGQTPLHKACKTSKIEATRMLIAAGADIHAVDRKLRKPLHILLGVRRDYVDSILDNTAVTVIQLLVSHGAEWDAKCDDMIEKNYARPEAPSLRVCLQLWAHKQAQGHPLTEVPLENIIRGSLSVQTYIDELKMSRNLVFRRKVCVVGPSNAGKTSLIQSLTTLQPRFASRDDRTIGIDHIVHKFVEVCADGRHKMHEVTFWDFAGQDEYRGAHSLFFSRRTLFLVCIDLDAFTTALLQASLFSDDPKQLDRMMKEFIDNTVLHWIRVICARQPDAEFVFVATKADLLDEDQEFAAEVTATLSHLLHHVEGYVDIVRCPDQRQAPLSKCSESELLGPAQVLLVSCRDYVSVQKARVDVENVIVGSEKRSYEMPDSYSRVLESVITVRQAAAKQTTSERLQSTFVLLDTLLDHLQPIGVDDRTCQIILQTLHDLGDILWYDELGIDYFRSMVILDPLLLIDFIGQVVNHNRKALTLPHNELRALPFWAHLDEGSQMLAMKRMLQHFNLVLPTAGEMRWDSDLMVPAFWRSKTCATWLFGGDVVRLDRTASGDMDDVRVHWEYQFVNNLPDTLFDQIVVACRSPFINLNAGPDWILFESKTVSACRIMVNRDHKTLHRMLWLEALLAKTATEHQARDLWEAFSLVSSGLERVLRGYRGLRFTRVARDNEGNSHSLESLFSHPLTNHAVKWMPPAPTWEAFKTHFE